MLRTLFARMLAVGLVSTFFGCGSSSGPDSDPNDWRNNFAAFADAVKRGDSFKSGEWINWEAEFVGVVSKEEQFRYDGVTLGGSASVQFRDVRPSGPKFKLAALEDKSGAKGDVWFECNPSDLRAWQSLEQGKKVHLVAKFDRFTAILSVVRPDGSSQQSTTAFAARFTDARIAK